jgi:hypothetical protein
MRQTTDPGPAAIAAPVKVFASLLSLPEFASLPDGDAYIVHEGGESFETQRGVAAFWRYGATRTMELMGTTISAKDFKRN